MFQATNALYPLNLPVKNCWFVPEPELGWEHSPRLNRTSHHVKTLDNRVGGNLNIQTFHLPLCKIGWFKIWPNIPRNWPLKSTHSCPSIFPWSITPPIHSHPYPNPTNYSKFTHSQPNHWFLLSHSPSIRLSAASRGEARCSGEDVPAATAPWLPPEKPPLPLPPLGGGVAATVPQVMP